MSRIENANPALGFLTCAICWGFSFIFINLGVSMEPALWMDLLWVALTILLTFIIMRLLLGVRVRLTRRQSVFALLLGIPGTALFMGLLSIAESSVAPGESSVLTYTYPIWVLLLSVPLLGEHLSPRKIAASLLGFGGVILIARIGTSGWSADLVPILELLGGSLGWSITNVAFKRLYKREEIFTANLYQFTGAILPLLVWAGLSEPMTALR